jgi:hypothetical protein
MVQGQYRSHWTAKIGEKKERSRLRWMDDPEADFSIMGVKM